LRQSQTRAKIVEPRMAVVIDTALVPPRERLDFWAESSCNAYVPLQVRSAERKSFWARMWADTLGPLSVFRITTAPNTMIRTSRAVAAGDPECLDLSVILRGQLNSAQDGRNGVARSGDLISKETSRPAVLRADSPFESIVVRVPWSLLGSDADEIGSRTAVTISGRDGLPRAAAQLLRELATTLERDAISDDEVPATVESVVDVIRSLYVGDGSPAEPRRLRSRAEILLAVESFIEANLGDPALGPGRIARASFISTRYLHKLFEAEGTSVCAWIRTARLERCRRDLLDPTLAHQTILSIASRWGLPGAQQFSRLFRNAYGCSPRELRHDLGDA
jgi:AraC-like DNA-binding protein